MFREKFLEFLGLTDDEDCEEEEGEEYEGDEYCE